MEIRNKLNQMENRVHKYCYHENRNKKRIVLLLQNSEEISSMFMCTFCLKRGERNNTYMTHVCRQQWNVETPERIDKK